MRFRQPRANQLARFGDSLPALGPTEKQLTQSNGLSRAVIGIYAAPQPEIAIM
jgi:hypothetical protein